jgi:DNA-binding XRE family transcriptional regulator
MALFSSTRLVRAVLSMEVKLTAQFLEIAGNKVAVLPIADYERLIEIADEREDNFAADTARARRLAGEEYVPFELSQRIIAGESPLRVWRTYRQMTLASLAKAAGSSQPMLTRIESGQLQGRPLLWRRLAEALKVDIEDILPLNDPE